MMSFGREVGQVAGVRATRRGTTTSLSLSEVGAECRGEQCRSDDDETVNDGGAA
jgi:hypothetical protein